jgi:hypothetical protein
MLILELRPGPMSPGAMFPGTIAEGGVEKEKQLGKDS